MFAYVGDLRAKCSSKADGGRAVVVGGESWEKGGAAAAADTTEGQLTRNHVLTVIVSHTAPVRYCGLIPANKLENVYKKNELCT